MGKIPRNMQMSPDEPRRTRFRDRLRADIKNSFNPDLSAGEVEAASQANKQSNKMAKKIAKQEKRAMQKEQSDRAKQAVMYTAMQSARDMRLANFTADSTVDYQKTALVDERKEYEGKGAFSEIDASDVINAVKGSEGVGDSPDEPDNPDDSAPRASASKRRMPKGYENYEPAVEEEQHYDEEPDF